MRIRQFVVLVVWSMLAVPAVAQQPSAVGEVAGAPTQPIVSIMTNGYDRDADLVRELAAAIAAKAGADGLRVLPIAGLGQTSNVRDLLYLRGIDFAVLNADVLKHLEIRKELPQAARRIRYVTRIGSKGVYLMARPEITRIEDLAGKRVMVLQGAGDSEVTARTILELKGIAGEVVTGDWNEMASALATGQVAALLHVASTPGELGQHLSPDFGARVLPIPLDERLSEVYETQRIEAADLPGLVDPEGTTTLSLPTVLAVFAFRKGNTRYGPVNSFIKELLQDVADARRAASPEPIGTLDLAATVPGWKRYEPAAFLVNATLPAVAAASPAPTVAPATPAAASGDGAARPVAALPSLGASISLAAQIERPLVDDGVAGGGLMTELVVASLDATTASSKTPPKIAVDWTAVAGESERRLIADRSADLGFPWRKPACAVGEADGADASAACRDLAYSEPVFQVVNGFFARSEGDFAFAADEQVIGRIICVAEGSDLADLDGNGRNWISQDLVTLLRAPSLDGCMTMVAKGEADAAFADEFSGRAAISRLGLGDDIEMADRPVSTTALHVAVAKSNPRAIDLIRAVDLGLGELKRTGRYAEIVSRQLAIMWGGQPSE